MELCETWPPGVPPQRVLRLDAWRAWLLRHGQWERYREDHRKRVGAFNTDPWPLPARFHRISWMRDRALDFLRRAGDERPWALVVSFPAPHSPLDPLEEFSFA